MTAQNRQVEALLPYVKNAFKLFYEESDEIEWTKRSQDVATALANEKYYLAGMTNGIQPDQSFWSREKNGVLQLKGGEISALQHELNGLQQGK